jgi:hypothetical protein
LIEIEVDALVADRAFDGLTVRLDEVQSQHGARMRELRGGCKFA